MTADELTTQAVADEAGMSLQELTWRVEEMREDGNTEEQIVAWLNRYAIVESESP